MAKWIRTTEFIVTIGLVGLLVRAVFPQALPVTAQGTGASLKISPANGIFEVGSLVDIAFVLDTGGESVNAVTADILFPADKLQVVNPAASTSFITIWVTAPAYSNTDGTIQFQGGVPNPGIKTSAGVVSTVTFRVKSPGPAELSFAPTSKVLRNDGQGTNILRSTGRAEYTLKNPPPAGPDVSSDSHPDGSRWYNNPTVQFSWPATERAVGYSYTFDQNAKSLPPETVNTTATQLSVTADSDGIWYFHLRAKAETWGGTTTVAVRIDTTPPAAFKPQLERDILTIEDTGILRFLTTDAASGIDHFEVKQVTKRGQPGQDTLFIEAISPYTIQPLPSGEYQFIVRAHDRAGNSTDGSVDLRVVAGGLPFFARVPLLRNPAIANTTLIVLGTVLTGLAAWVVFRRIRIRTTFRRDLEILERDARKKAAALQQEIQEIRRAESIIHRDIGHDPTTNQSGASPIAPPSPF